jgi:hypothetical protein
MRTRWKPWPRVLIAGILAGLIFNGLFVASWVEFFFGDGDDERALFCSFLEVFAFPLLIGSILALRGHESCLKWLRVGALMFIVVPTAWRALSHLDCDESYLAYMSDDE